MPADAPHTPGLETANQPVTPFKAGTLRTAVRLPPTSYLVLLIGLVVLAWGLYWMTRRQPPDFLPREILDALPDRNDILGNSRAAIFGSVVALVGALLVGLEANNILPDVLAGLTLPLPSQPLLRLVRRDRVTLAALVLVVLCTGKLYWDLAGAGKNYTHWDIALFLVGLALAAFVVHRLDTPTRPSTLHFTRLDVLTMIFVALLATVVYSVQLTGWQFAWVGDEGEFFNVASAIADGRNTNWNFFGQNIAYGMHPMFDSLYQTAGMHVFGVNILGLRSSEVLLMAASTALMYPLAVALLGRLPALAACVVMASNHYLIAFSRIGYNSNHPVFFGSLAMLMLVLAWRTQRAVFVFLTGVTAGLCLYTFRIALLMWPILALSILDWSLLKSKIQTGTLMLLGFALTVIPTLLVVSPVDQFRVAATYSYVNKNPISSMYTGLINSALSFWDNYAWHSHFVGGPLMDAVSGLLLAVGLTTALFRINKRVERLVLTWFAGGVILSSITSWGVEAHLTRMQEMIPGAALLVGLAISKFQIVMSAGLKLPAILVTLLLIGPLVAVPPLNLYTLLVDGPPSEESNSWILEMKAIQEHPNDVIVEVGPGPEQDFAFSDIVQRYPWLAGRYRYVPISVLTWPRPEGPANRLPIYVVTVENEAIVPNVKAILPEYQVLDDHELADRYRIWMFLPP